MTSKDKAKQARKGLRLGITKPPKTEVPKTVYKRKPKHPKAPEGRPLSLLANHINREDHP